MKKRSHRSLLVSTCLTGVVFAWASGAQAQEASPTWQPRAEIDARAGDGNSQVSLELFTPLAQNDANLMFVAGRIGTDERNHRNGSVTVGGRGKVGDDFAIGVNAGVDFTKSDLTRRGQTAVSFGLEGFTSVFDLRLNYRMPLDDRRTIGFVDPDVSPVGALSIESNRLIETRSGFRLEEVPLAGVNGEIGARVPLAANLSARASAGGFDYRDRAADRAYRGIRGGLEIDVEDPLGTGGRFTIGAEVQDDNRWGTQARGLVRLSIPLGRGSRDRSMGATGLDRQMGDRVRRAYVTPSGSRFTDLTSTSFAIDNRTGQAFGGIYFTNGAATAAGAGTSASPTTLGDAVTRAGANGVVVALGDAGTITTGGVTLAANQYLVGGASSVDVRRSNGTVTAFGFGGTNGTIVGSNAGGAAVTLGQGSVLRDVTVRGAGSGVLASGVGGFALQRVTIENTGAAGLTLANTTGNVVIDGITIRGGAGAGVLVNGGSNVTLRNSAIGGGAGAIDINDAGGNLTATLSNLTLSATSSTVLDIDGSGAGTVTVAGLSGLTIAGGNGETGGFAARSVTFDGGTAAGVQTVDAGTMQVGSTAARVGGAGVSLADVDGALNFAALNVANNGGTGLTVANDKTGTFTLTNTAGTIDTTAGAALDLDPLAINLTFASVSSVGATGPAVLLDDVQGLLTIGTLTIANSGGQGLFLTGGSTGQVTIGGGSITNSAGASVQVGAAGVAGSGGTIGLTYGGTIADTGAGPLVSIFNAGGAIRFTGAISGSGPITLADTLAGSSVTFEGATTITGSASPAVSLANLAGSTTFSGLQTIANPVGTGIAIGAVPGGVAFGDVDITGLGAGTGVDLTGAQGNVIFASLDISGTGAAGSTGIDLTGATNAGAVTVSRSSTIQGVDIGVNLTDANISGSFRYGDANAADGLGSRISANTPLVVAGMNAAQGTYDFSDVELDGDTNNITGGSFTSYYVLAGASGAGTASDPGSIAGAAASGAQYIVLLNDPTGGQDVIDTAGLMGGALSLTADQSLVSFLNTDFFAVTGATVPSNLILSDLGPTGIVNSYAGSGAAVLTSSAGLATVNLADNVRVDGVIVQNNALGVGIAGAGVSNAIVRNSSVSGNGGAIRITDNGVTASVTLTNLNLASSGGVALALDGSGAGTVNVSGTGLTIAATGAAQGLAITDLTVGALDIASITTGTSGGTAVQVAQAAGGTLTIGSVTVGGTTAGAGLGVANSSATVNIGAVTTTGTAGDGVTLAGNIGAITLGPVSVTNSGANGLRLTGNSGTVALGGLTVSGAAGTALDVVSAPGTVTISGATITGAVSGVALADVAGNVTVGATSITGVSGTGIRIGGVTGAATFTGTTTMADAGIVLGAGSTGTIAFGDVDLTGLGAGKTGLDARAAGGTVTFNTLDVTGASTAGTRGIDLTGATFAGSLTVSESSTITGVGIGVDLTNAAISGSVRFGDASSIDADGAASTISALTPIAIGGFDTSTGFYNFADVVLLGDTTSLATNPTSLYFVEQGAAGTGTKTDPGSIAGAAASGADVIVLLNNPTGGQDLIDATSLGSLTLGTGQRLIGFLNGDSQAVGGGTPANMVLYGIAPSLVTNPYAGSGASLLTSTGAGPTVTLGMGSSIDGVRIGGAGLGVYGSGVANVSITNSIIAGNLGAIELRSGGGAASATLTNLALSATGGIAANFIGTGGSLVLAGSSLSVTGTGDARALAIDRVTLDGNLDFNSVSTQTANGIGVYVVDTDGSGALGIDSLAIGGTTTGAGVLLADNNADIGLGTVTVANTLGEGIAIFGGLGNLDLGTFTITDAGTAGLRVDGMPGALTAQSGTITGGATGIELGNIGGSASFLGQVTIADPGTAGIVLGANSTGTIAFADTAITGLAANTTGLDARSASGTVTFATLDITGASAAGTRGIDLTGATFGGDLTIAGSSTITGVGTGVDLTNAAITGAFRFGDGSNTDANGAGSTISATIPLTAAGLNALSGSYDFADVNLVGDTSALATSATVYWVLAGATGSGTRGDPGSLAGAAASGADVIILFNNPAGGNDTLDVNGAGGTGGTFNLIDGQQLRGFLNGDTIALPGGAPANVSLFNIAQGYVTNPFAGSGAPTLTSTALGTDTVRVLGNNLIDGLRITSAGTGIIGNGAANVAISNSIISGADSAIELASSGGAATASLSNLVLTSTGASIPLAISATGGGSMIVSQLSNITITQGSGSYGAFLQGATFDADLTAAGYQVVDSSMMIGDVGNRINSIAVNLTNALGALNFTGLSIYNQGGVAILASGSGLALTSTAGTIDTLNGANISLNGTQADLVLDNVVHTGTGTGITITNLTGIGTGGRALDIASFQSTGGTNGITFTGTNDGAVRFGAGSSIGGASSAAIAIESGADTLDLTYLGSITQANNAALVSVANHNGTITFGAGSTLNATDGTGLQFTNADGTYVFNGSTTLNGGDAGIDILSGSAGNFTFGAGTTITSPSGTAIEIANSTAGVTYLGTIDQATTGALALDVAGHSVGRLDFTGATFAVTGGDGLSFDDADGTYDFGNLALSGGSRLAILNGSAGGFTFGDVDITGLAANTTAADLTGATGNVTFGTLDITGASATGTRGIDLTGSTTAGAITVTGSSTISGVDTGIDLTNAAITGTFRYGDGSNSDANGAGSSIIATTPLVIAGLNGGLGTYNFADVNLIGDTSALSVSAYFVRAGATGSGSLSNPGSLAGAEASGAAYIVLLNDPTGGTDLLDATVTAGGSLDLAGGQALLSFRDQDSFNVGGGAPANVVLYNVQSGVISNPFAGSGAPTLTAGGGNATVTLGGNNLIDGLVIANSSAGAGVLGIGIGGSSIVRNSTIAGGAAGALHILDGAMALDNLTLSANGGRILDFDGSGGGIITLSQFSNLNVLHTTETGGFRFNTVTFDADPAAAGIQAVNAGALTLGTSGSRITGDGLDLTNVSGSLTFTNIDIANNGGTGLRVANSKANNFLLTTLDGIVDTTNGTAVDLDPLVVNMTLDSVAASGGAYGVLLDQVEGSFTVTGAVSVTGATTAGVAIQNNTVQATPLSANFNGAVTINNTTGAGLSLTNNTGATIAFAGGGTGVDLLTTSGAGLVASGGGTISFSGGGNTIQTATGQVLSLANVTAAGGGITFASLASTGTVAGATAINLNNLDGGAFNGGTVAIAGTSGAASDGIFIGGGSGSAVSFGATTIAGTGDEGIEINGGGNGAISFSSVTIDNTAGDGVFITGSNGNVTISAGAIGATNDPSGVGVNVSGGAGGTIAIGASISKTTAGRTVQVDGRTSGSVTFSGNLAASGAAGGLYVANNSNSANVTFSGVSKSLNVNGLSAVDLFGNSGATIDFINGGLAITSAATGLNAVGGGTFSITGAGNTISSGAGNPLVLNGIAIAPSGINFANISTNATTGGLAFSGVGGGAITLGTVNLQGVSSRGVDIGGAFGSALTIADLDIGLTNAGAVAFDLSGAALATPITVGDFDVASSAAPGTSIGVDLRGTTGGQIVRLGDASAAGAVASIAGVATGIWLDAGTNAAFTFGDGEATIDGASTISAVTAINASSAPAAGTYDFRDVTFGASPGLGFGVGRTLFVDSNGATGGGNGSGADGANPMTLAAAELSLAATDVIVLVNNGAAISTAGSNGNDTLALLANTQVRGFGQGPLGLTLTVPSTILLSNSTINIADPTGNGAATLTSAAGADVITLGASGNRISGFILDGAPGGALRGIVDNGGASGAIVNFMTVRNFSAVGGYGVEITPSTNSTIDNVSFTGNTNDLFLNAAGSSISNVTATGATGTAITLNNATGTTTLTNVNISGAATGLSFTTPAGTINATNVDISGASTSALTIGSGTASFNFDAASSIVQAAAGTAVNLTGNHTTGTLAFAGLINATNGSGLRFDNADGTYNFTGTTNLNGGDAGIDIVNGATGTFAFGSGTSITHNAAGDAFTLSSSANVTYDGTIIDNNGSAVAIDGHDAGTVAFNGAISSGLANSGTVVSILNSNAGAIGFNGQMSIQSTGTVVNLAGNDGSAITFNAGGTGLDIVSTTGVGMAISGGGTVNVLGSGNSIATSSGTLLNVANTGATSTTANLAFATFTNTGGANGIVINRTAGTLGGTVAIGGGAVTAANRGIALTGDALNFSYGGTITTSGAAARSFEATSRTGGTVALSGNLTDTSQGINIANNTGGAITFSGQSVSLSTGANNALTLANNSGSTVSFASAAGGNGFDIVTSSGIGLNASGGGNLTVIGSGNSIQTATGQILSLSGVSAGPAGISFGSLQSTGTVTGVAVNFNNFDSIGGGGFSGGTTSIAATTAGDGIFIGNGSNATIGFGATTIGTTAGTIGGDGIEINGSGNGAISFASVDIDGTTAHGLNVTGAAGATGAVTINGGTIGATASSAGDGVNLTGGGTSVTVAAAITKTNAGNIVEVSDRAAGSAVFLGNLSATGGLANGILVNNNSGGTVTFSGASKVLSTGANNAIQFDNNNFTGAAVSFTGGGLAITSAAGRGITATSTTAGAGSLAITGTGNSITSAGGIALNLVNTNIGGAGLTFQSVSANGGARGIVLNTTGAAGGLTITGTGATDGSGGTIQNITQRGIELLNTALVSIANLNLTNASTTGQAAGQDADLITANGAIYLNNVATAVFNNIDITGTIADNGITGTNVSNFQLNNSLIDNAGDGANESGIEFVNLSGTSSLTNTEIRFSETNSLDIYNTDVNLNLTLNNVVFRDTQSSATNGEGGLQFRSFSNAAGAPITNIDILDSDFLRLRTQGIQIVGEDDSIVNVDITNNVINVDTGIGTGIDINGNDSAAVNFNIIGNPTILASGGAAVNITSFLNATVMGRIASNSIAVFSQSGTSNASGSGVRLLAQESSRLIAEVSGNAINMGAFNNSAAVDVTAREGSARLDLRLLNNIIASTDTNTLADINIISGSSSANNIETSQIYAFIANNNLTATAPTNKLRLRVSKLDNTHDPRIFLQGFVEGGNGLDDDAVATWNANGNTPGANTGNINVSLSGTATAPSAGNAVAPTNPLP